MARKPSRGRPPRGRRGRGPRGRPPRGGRRRSSRGRPSRGSSSKGEKSDGDSSPAPKPKVQVAIKPKGEGGPRAKVAVVKVKAKTDSGGSEANDEKQTVSVEAKAETTDDKKEDTQASKILDSILESSDETAIPWERKSAKPIVAVYGHIDRISSREAGRDVLERYKHRFGHELDRDLIIKRRQERLEKLRVLEEEMAAAASTQPVIQLVQPGGGLVGGTQVGQFPAPVQGIQPIVDGPIVGGVTQLSPPPGVMPPPVPGAVTPLPGMPIPSPMAVAPVAIQQMAIPGVLDRPRDGQGMPVYNLGELPLPPPPMIAMLGKDLQQSQKLLAKEQNKLQKLNIQGRAATPKGMQQADLVRMCEEDIIVIQRQMEGLLPLNFDPSTIQPVDQFGQPGLTPVAPGFQMPVVSMCVFLSHCVSASV